MAVRPERDSSPIESPVLLRELEPWHRVFLHNLSDLVLRREPPPLELTAQPIPVGPDKFIRTGIGPRSFAESGGLHIAAVVVIYVLCTLPLLHRAPKLASPFENTKVEYYPLSDYLPPLNTGKANATKPRTGAPKLAKQEILSVPPEADNKKQTIITPPKVKLDHDVPLPNIVAWTPVPAAQPIAASARPVSQLMLPQFDIPVVEPTADVSKLKSKLQTPTLPQPAMVEPSADVSHLNAKSKLPALPQAALLEPTLSPDQLKLKTGQINMAQLDSGLSAPKLPVEPQRTSGTTESGGKAGKEAAANIPAQPNVSGLGATAGQGQLIALGLNPVDIRGPVSAPAGNRSGEFHASPGGKPDAPGTPNVTGTGKDADVSGGPGGKNTRAPTGIYVAQPPAGANASAVAGTPVKSPASAKPDMEARKRIIAAAMNPNLPNPARVSPPPVRKSPDVVEPTIEQRVFGKKTYYSLVLNMPNLTSATGSWIIRFAELQQNPDKSAVTAPVATTKVDPAYAPDALRDHIEGTVTLYAIIHTDGTVSQIRVLDSLDDRLDANAVHALAGWHFRPGTKNGAPVDLEAVVQIPFRMRHFQQ